ncbi:ATP-dependent zinc metalloprotease FtsH [mine drainage metagenome]|uniref:ATP-dependent zinc metalloprotease FtsH n=1 Tax=mine drainage metagenome TaxID=410659 RepID=A0A1J5RU00_9ZZZZ
MEHFSIIQSLCRIGLGANEPAFRRQVERLQESLLASGAEKEAVVLARLLATSDKGSELRPSKLSLSGGMFRGERLNEKTPPPVDKETGAPLAEIRFPMDADTPLPILGFELQKALESLVMEWSNLDALGAMEVHPATSCLVYGLPGTGKTQIAIAIANRLNLPLVIARLDGLISSFLGTTARNIANLFHFANRYQCILLLDEFDAVAKIRDDPHEVGEIKRVVNTLLQSLDARARIGLTLAITNHENLLDKAIWRRFEVRIFIPLPETQSREKIISQYFPPLRLSDVQLGLVSWLTEGFSGADIETMSRNVKRYMALNPQEEFLAALRSYVLTNAGQGAREHQKLILSDQHELARALYKEDARVFNQANLASLFGKTQPTIARWLKAD